MVDAELDPPHRQPAQAAERLRRERRPVVGSNRGREPVLTEEPLKLPVGGVLLDRYQSVAGEDEARVGVADRQRVAELAVAHAKLAFVVGGPDGVGHLGHERCRAGMLRRAALALRLRQAIALKDGGGRADGWPFDAGVPTSEVRKELACAPGRVCPPGLDEERFSFARRLRVLGQTRPAAIRQSLGPSVTEALDPLVDGGP